VKHITACLNGYVITTHYSSNINAKRKFNDMVKEVDFWSLLKAYNDYGHWLSDRLVEHQIKYQKENDKWFEMEPYVTLKTCRSKMKEIFDEIHK
jgi:hypothetical protein